MAPRTELKFFDFTGGFNTELGLVNTNETVSKDLLNVDLESDGSAKRRSGLVLFEDDLIDSGTIDLTSQRSSTGWVYPAPALHIWRTIVNNQPTDVLFAGGLRNDVSGNVSVSNETLTNGIADIERWSTTSGAQNAMFNLTTVNNATTANTSYRFSDAGNRLLVMHADAEPGFVLNTDFTTLNNIPLLIRDPNSLTVDDVVQHNGLRYVCINSHTSLTGVLEPGIFTSPTGIWQEAGIATTEPAWVTATVYVSSVKPIWEALFGTPTGVGEKHVTHAEFVGGRVWYTGIAAAPTTIYVTQPLLDETSADRTRLQLGFAFSVNDPRSATESSASAADGGTITIREAGIIKAITTFREGLIVFGTKGVWSIPNAGNFNALSFDVLKVSDVAIAGPDSFAVTDFGVVYAGRNSVQVITITDNGNLVSQEISTPIKTFYNSISEVSKETGFMCYNKNEQRIYWFTTFVEPSYTTANGPYRTVNFNTEPCAAQDILIFDFKLKAWFKHSVRKDQDLTDNDLMISSCVTFVGDFGEEANIINLAGDNVVNAALDNIVSSNFDGTNIQEFTIMLVTSKKTIAAGADVFRYGFAHMQGDVDQDFDTLPIADAVLKSTFDTEILTQNFNFNDIGHQKTAPYIHTIFQRVESGIIDAGGNDITPGGCLLQFRWNWATGPKAGVKFGIPFQAYKPFRIGVNPADGSLPDIETVLNKHKVLGRGKSLQFKFTNDGTKRFHLLGYQLELEATRKV